MNENYVNNDITFRKILKLFKKSIVRIVIFVLILCILGGGITMIVSFTGKGNVVFQAAVEYNYSGIENGLDPLGVNILNPNAAKSATLVNSTLAGMGFKDSEIQEIGNSVISNLAINGYIPAAVTEEMKTKTDIVFHPTKYYFTMTKDRSIPFNNNQYVTFINSLISNYTNYFKETYNYSNLIAVSIGENAIEESNDYISLVQTYRMAMLDIKAGLDAVKAKVPGIYGYLSGKVNILMDNLDNLENYILNNNVVKNDAPMSISDYFNSKKNEYENLATINKDMANEIGEIVKNYKFPTITTTTESGLIITKDVINKTANYDNLINQITLYRNLESKYNTEKNNIDAKIGLLSNAVCTDAQKEKVEERLGGLYTNYVSTINSVNESLDEFYNLYVGENGVVMVEGASKSAVLNIKVIAIVIVLCALVGIVAAMWITDYKSKQNSKKINAIKENENQLTKETIIE